MLHRLISKITKFQLPPPKRLSIVVKNILGAIMPPPPCQVGLKLTTQEGIYGSWLKLNVSVFEILDVVIGNTSYTFSVIEGL